MPEPITVWKVELVRGSEPLDVRGTLSMSDDALVFADDDGAATPIRFADLETAKRLRGSPVLVIRHVDRARGETAFYFTEPPPLQPPDPATLSLREATRRKPSQRRQRRDNTGYLAGHGRALRPTIEGWATETRAKILATRSDPGRSPG
jgi:hypothetical protein